VKNVRALKTENERLRAALKRLQNTISPSPSSTSTTAQPATCLLVLMMSLALIAAPNFRSVADEKDTMSVEESNTAVTGLYYVWFFKTLVF